MNNAVGKFIVKISLLSIFLIFQANWVQSQESQVTTTDATAKGKLQVIVTPGEANILVTGPEGIDITFKNGEVRELDEGSYVIKASNEGYTPVTKNVDIKGGESEKLELSLEDVSKIKPGLILLILVIASGVGAFIVSLLRYLHLLQKKYYDTVLGTIGRVDEVLAVQTPAFAAGLMAANTKTLAVAGPKIIKVGKESSAFTIIEADGIKVNIANPVVDVTTLAWSVNPIGQAIVSSKDLSAKIYCATSGSFKLKVTANDQAGNTTYEGEFDFIATSDLQSKLELPWVGAGYGSLIVAITILGTITILGYSEILSGEAIATILGALAGYLFGNFNGNRDNKSEDSQSI
jgi:hypothetical protein